jgi:hypothetical protein
MSEPQQQPPGTLDAMRHKPDHGEDSYRGSGRLAGKKTVITGGDSRIGRAVAIAFAREGADVLISYLSEHEDAHDTAAMSSRQAGPRSWWPGTWPTGRSARRWWTPRWPSLGASTSW